MFSRFDPSGQICEATIQPIVAVDREKSPPVLTERLADELIEEVVPTGVRGAPERFLDPDSTVAGGVYEVKTNYPVVTVEKIGFFSEASRGEAIQIVSIKWRKRECR